MLSWGHSLPCSSKYLQNKTGKKSFLFLLFKVPIRLTEESCTSSWCPPSKGVKKKKGEKVITLLLLLTRPRLCHFQIKPVFYTTYSERPPTPPLPNFTFASLGLFLNQVMRKHKNDFSDRIIMDGIVKKKSTELFTCLNNYWGWRIPFVGSVLCGGEDGRQRQSINQVRQKVSVLFYSKRILHFQVRCSGVMKPAAASSHVALQLCARTCKAFQPFTQFISLSNKSSQAFLSKASLLVKEWRTASFDSARKGKKPNGGASFISRWH